MIEMKLFCSCKRSWMRLIEFTEILKKCSKIGIQNYKKYTIFWKLIILIYLVILQ